MPTVGDAWKALCKRWGESGYDSLSDSERLWFNVRGLIDAVENGGLISFFYNSGADTLPDCISALRRLHSEPVVAQIERVAGLFPSEALRSLDERNRVIESWPDDGTHDALLEEVDEHLTPQMPELEEKLEAFLVQAGILGS